MKATKVILAIMAVAMMVIVPLSVADVDAGKEITDAYAGTTVSNDRDISYTEYDNQEYYKRSSLSKDYLYSYAFEYCNVKPSNMTVTSMKLTTYDYNVFSEQSGKEYTIQYGYTLKGTITFTYSVAENGNYPFYTSNTSETDLLNVANKELGTATTSDVITVSGDFEVVYVYKEYDNYKEAKDTYVIETTESKEYCKGISNAKITLKDKSVNINIDYAYDVGIKNAYDLSSITKDTETSDIPSKVQCSTTGSYGVYKASLNGTVADKEYTSDLDKKLNDTLKSRIDGQTKTESAYTTTNSDLICAPVSIEYVYYNYYGYDIKEYLKDSCGCTGETNASGARDRINSQVNSVTGNSGDSGFSIWIIVAIVIAVIVIAVIVVLLIKKKQ